MRYIFGFGSLVNDATHDYEIIAPASVSGFARQWVSAIDGQYSFLSASPQSDVSIKGLVLGVAEEKMAALAEREARYELVELNNANIQCNQKLNRPVYLYQAESDAIDQFDKKPILQSYLDCVFAGFETHLGTASIAEFIKSSGK